MKCQAMDTSSTVTTEVPIPQKPFGENKLVTEPENTIYANQQTFPTEKLHQAILAFRPVSLKIQLTTPTRIISNSILRIHTLNHHFDHTQAQQLHFIKHSLIQLPYSTAPIIKRIRSLRPHTVCPI